MAHVLVVGSVNLDLVVAVPRLPVPGETVLGADVMSRPGGKGANQAVAAARLGAATTLVAAVGDDRFGADLRAALAGERMSTGHVATMPDTASGVALIVVDPDGENVITVSPGANNRLSSEHLAALPELLSADTVVVLQLEIPLPTCLAAAQLASEAGARIVLNAAPAPGADDRVFDELIASVDVLVVNEAEATQLARQAPPSEASGWTLLARDLRQRGPDTVVVTLGEHGAVAVDAMATHVQPGFAVTAVDTTGAGDGFCGALAAALADHRTLPDALRTGCAAGALATTRVGAQSALPTAAELRCLL